MLKILKYSVVKTTLSKLEEDIQNYIDNGWQPYGNSLLLDEFIYQPVVKYDDMPDFSVKFP